MKIAIMTQPLGKNYGGIMQAWALQQVLKRMGHEPVTIDRQPDTKNPVYQATRLGYRAAMKALGKRTAPINIERNQGRYLPTITQNTRAFIDQHIAMSEPLDSTAKLQAHFERNHYDAVIVGSDQTWRPRYSPNIYNFFLDFLQAKAIKRIAYASSFGVDHWEYTKEQTRRCAELAKQFDAISVREDSGIDLCSQHLGVTASHVLDPTLLLEKNTYEQLIGKNRLANTTKGIYTYFLDKSPEKLALSKQASEEFGDAIFSYQAKLGIEQGIKGEIDNYIMPDIKDWLSGFANARFVLTDSFHGMVFSIIFRKPFLIINNPGRGTTRFKSLLQLSGNLDRFKEAGEIVNFAELIKKIKEPQKSFADMQSASLKIIEAHL